MTQRRISLLTIAVLMALAWMCAPAFAADQPACFAETGQCIDPNVNAFWRENGGLDVFGMPLAPLATDSTGRQFQLFERHTIELHPEHAAPYNVELAQIGRTILYAHSKANTPAPAVAANPNCRFFPETGHNLCEPFRAFWGTHGLHFDSSPSISDAEALALFGLPLTEAFPEMGSDGATRTVQYFERARFELHPENPEAYRVQLGLLGREVAQLVSQDQAPAPTSPAPTPPMPTQPAPAPTQPAPAPTPAPAPSGTVTITREPGTVGRGGTASVAARSAPGIECDITVEYKSGASQAAGLYPKTTDGRGDVSWSWKVGTRTTSGSWPVTITCGRASATTYLNVP